MMIMMMMMVGMMMMIIDDDYVSDGDDVDIQIDGYIEAEDDAAVIFLKLKYMINIW